MKKVSGYISVRALGTYDYEFYVPDDTSDEEIGRMVEKQEQLSHNYFVEEGYEEYTEVKYKKSQVNTRFFDYDIDDKTGV